MTLLLLVAAADAPTPMQRLPGILLVGACDCCTALLTATAVLLVMVPCTHAPAQMRQAARPAASLALLRLPQHAPNPHLVADCCCAAAPVDGVRQLLPGLYATAQGPLQCYLPAKQRGSNQAGPGSRT